MKNLFLSTCFATAVAVAFSNTSYAQTPDGQTPANEGVCDVLQADGTTKGLYGLCVAFCEAHDAAALDEPITLEELEALEASAPSGKILTNYNKRKTDSDPDMPCIMVEEPCPCWTQADLDRIDGFRNNDGGQSSLFECNLNLSNNFLDNLNFIQEFDFGGGNIAFSYAFTLDAPDQSGGDKICEFLDRGRPNPTSFSFLSVNQGTLTEQQFDACRVQLEEFIPTTACDLINP